MLKLAISRLVMVPFFCPTAETCWRFVKHSCNLAQKLSCQCLEGLEALTSPKASLTSRSYSHSTCKSMQH